MNIKSEGWELVPRKTRVLKLPTITLSKVGVIAFSYSCVGKFELDKYNYVRVYHNVKKKMLGFEFIPAYEEEAMTVNKHSVSKGLSVSARVLLDELGFFGVRTQAFEASKEGDMVVINYGKSKER